MITLKVKIKSQPDAKILAKFLRTLGYVKSVSFKKPVKPLADEDWILPGRPAAEAEIKQLFEDMDKDGEDGITTQQLKKELARWSKRIYR